MGELIALATMRRARMSRWAAATRSAYYFDLSCPFSYLAAERVERAFPDIAWRPALATALRRAALRDPLATERLRRAAELRAAALRMPLQWPDRFPADVPAAMRAAAYACEQGRGGAFVLAAGRLAFCGGFDLDDPEILAEAAAAAGIGLDETLAAARDAGRDGAAEATARHLLACGARRLPALRQGRKLVFGEARIGELAVAARARAVALSS